MKRSEIFLKRIMNNLYIVPRLLTPSINCLNNYYCDTSKVACEGHDSAISELAFLVHIRLCISSDLFYVFGLCDGVHSLER